MLWFRLPEHPYFVLFACLTKLTVYNFLIVSHFPTRYPYLCEYQEFDPGFFNAAFDCNIFTYMTSLFSFWTWEYIIVYGTLIVEI